MKLDVENMTNKVGILRPESDFIALEQDDLDKKSWFSETFNSLLRSQSEAEQAASAFGNGENEELHKTMLKLEKADLSLKFFVNLRNRCLEAYQEVMRMGG